VVRNRLDDNVDVERPLATQAALVPHQTVFGAPRAGGGTRGLHVVDSARRSAAQRVPFGTTNKAFSPKRYARLSSIHAEQGFAYYGRRSARMRTASGPRGSGKVRARWKPQAM
jgi:hypothetical protein